MAPKVLFVIVLVCCCTCACESLRLPYTQVDALFLTRCRTACFGKIEKQNCESQCLLTTSLKPGQCPRNITRRFDAACIHSCSEDTECPGIEKCCSHSCGITCQVPEGLESVEGLPSIPENVTMLERGQYSAHVHWQMSSKGPSPVMYVVEERHHPGKHWEPAYLGKWTVRNKTNKTRCVVKNLIAGHWYEVRVAAVNEYGTRGFSQPTTRFSLNIKPRAPSMPENLEISKLGWVNGTLYGVLSWELPESDLPVLRYKVFWSCMKENTTEKTVQILQATISSKHTSYTLKGLEPQSLYFLQVQALSQFGKERLKSEKKSIFLNTRHQKGAKYDWQSKHRKTKGSGNHGLRNTGCFWENEQLHCNIEWKGQSSSEYMLTWMPSSCHTASSLDTFEISTKNQSYSIYGLKFDCKYKIILQETSRHKQKLGTMHFTTPSCKQYKGKPGNNFC